MKFTMGSEKGDTMPVVFQDNTKLPRLSTGWKIAIVTTAVVLLATVVAGIVFASVYIGGETPPDNSTKEYVATVYIDNTITRETIQISDREEKFTTPDAVAIFDFQTGFAVYKMNNNDRTCYLASFNLTELEFPQQFKSQHSQTEVSFVVESRMERVFKATDIWVNMEVLGTMGRLECGGKSLYMLQDVTGSVKTAERESRAWSFRLGISFGDFFFGLEIKGGESK